MKYFNILFFVIFLSIGSSAIAQPLKPSANTTTSSYKSSIPGWYVNVQKANVESAKTGKPILANFTGSDWCGWCMKLRREVFDTPEFQEWAKKNVVLLELDYPRKKWCQKISKNKMPICNEPLVFRATQRYGFSL